MTCEQPIPLNLLGPVIQGPPGEVKNNLAILQVGSYAEAVELAKTSPSKQQIVVKVDETHFEQRTLYEVDKGVPTFKEYLPGIFNGPVNVRYFGAHESNSAEANTEAFKAAAAFAESKGKPLYADGTFNIKASANPIEIKTSFDFGSAKFICRDVGLGDFGGGLVIFVVAGSPLEVVTVPQAELAKNVDYVPSLAGRTGFIDIQSTTLASVRQLGTTRTNVFLGESNEVVKGYLSATLLFDYTAASGVVVRFRANDRKLKGVLPLFDLEGAWITAPVQVKRNDVVLSNFDKVGHLGSYLNIDVQDCHTTTVEDVFTQEQGTVSQIPGAKASYVCTLTRHFNSRFVRVHNRLGWDCVDGNYFRKHVVEDSEVVSFGGHSMCADQELKNSTIRNSSQLMWYGYLKFTNIVYIPNQIYSASYISIFLQARLDYGPHGEGDLEIDGLRVICQKTTSRLMIFRDEMPMFDHAPLVSRAPRNVKIKNVVVEYSSETDSIPTSNVFILYGYILNYGAGVSTYIDKKIMPENYEFENIVLRPTINNTAKPSKAEIRLVDQFTAFKSFWTAANFPTGKFRITARDIKIPAVSTLGYTDRAYYPINTLDVDLPNVYQEIRVHNSDLCGVRLTTENNVEARFYGGKLSGTLARGFTRSKAVKDIWFYYQGTEFFGFLGADVNATYGNDAALVVNDCRLRFPARMYNQEHTSTSTHQLGYNSAICVVAASGNVVDKAANAYETFNINIPRLTNGYVDTNYFYKP